MMPLAAKLGTQISSRPFWIGLAQVIGFALLTAFAAKAQFYLPFSPVPITLQSLIVLLAGAVLGSKKGAASQLSLIGMGFAGLPVFTLPLPGSAVLLGPTGGYIWGFVLAAFAMGLFLERFKRPSLAQLAFFIMTAKALIFIPGLLWLSFFIPGWSAVLTTGLWPFIPGAVLKGIVLIGILRGLNKIPKFSR